MSVSWSQTKENRVAGNATKLKCHLAVFLSVRIKAVMAQILGFITYQLPSPVKKTQNQRQLWEMSVSGDKINKILALLDRHTLLQQKHPELEQCEHLLSLCKCKNINNRVWSRPTLLVKCLETTVL